MIRGAICAALLCANCATPYQPPTLPPATDVEALLGPQPPMPVVPEGLPGGKDRAVDEGQCKGLPSGIWVSERKYAERIVIAAERERLSAELVAYQKLRRTERDSFLALQNELSRRLVAADRRAEIRLFTGIVVGAAAVLAGGWAIAQAGH